MGDLISRKRLLEHISAWQQANAGAETQTEYAVIESCYRMAQNFPAGYDVEAVVRELEEELDYHVKHQLKWEHKGDELKANRHRQQVIAYDTAIAIVKRGGRNE